ncbi:hypothetical protein V2J09_020485 [Rumex salicifolius]
MAFSEGGGRVSRERWKKHYSSFHQILLVGEGDFSFALCLARSFDSASNIVATSFDSYEDVVINKYKRGSSNLMQLRSFGATLIFGVDATNMKYSATDLANWRFDRIVYNFPHAGFHGKEDDHKLIKRHQELVSGFFHNASQMLRPHGEIHVSHKTSTPFCNWNIEELAFRSSLNLLQRVPFNIDDYQGYENKRGDGLRPDDPFPLGECCTYKFGYRYGCIRINICGVSMGEPGLAGCGGVMIDEARRLSLVFCEPLGILKYEVAELCAFVYALRRLIRPRLGHNRFVVIESTSQVAVSWINNPSTRPASLLRHFVEIDASLNGASGVRIENVMRKDNEAESLAKRAILTGASFEAYSGYSH